MKLRPLLILTFAGLAFISNAQSKNTIVEKKIKSVKTYEQDIEQGEKKMLIETEEFFNKNGELIEFKEFDEKGRIKEWNKFEYSAEGKLIEEKELDYRGETDKRIVHVYKDGIKVEKLYYDDKDRLYKKKKYEVEFRK